MIVELVHDGGDELHIPGECGKPRRGHPTKGDQLVGSINEQKAELAGRVCYDSLGQGRSSEEYHKHIREVNHNSVWGHTVHHFEIYSPHAIELILSFANIPGVTCTQGKLDGALRYNAWFITINNRTLVHHMDRLHKQDEKGYAIEIFMMMFHKAWTVDLHILSKFEFDKFMTYMRSNDVEIKRLELSASKAVMHAAEFNMGRYVDPAELIGLPRAEEYLSHGWTTWYLSGISRGCTHEHVRHGWHTAISQRSTRYVDESESEWAWHPLIHLFLADPGIEMRDRNYMESELRQLEKDSKIFGYNMVVERLQKYLKRMYKVDKLTARKQARGAARGFLGNALTTSMLWSASFDELLYYYLPQRVSKHADAEIRIMASYILDKCQDMWPQFFGHLKVEECPDGIGVSLVG